VQEQLEWVQEILDSAPDDCVRTLAFEGRSYLEKRKAVEKLIAAASEANLGSLAAARRILSEQWPLLKAGGADGDLQAKAEELAVLLQSEECLYRIETLKAACETLGSTYRQVYTAAFDRRKKAYAEALETIKGRPEWLAFSESPDISAEGRESLLKPLLSRAGAEMDLPAGATVCRRTGATLPQLESETQAAGAVASEVLRRLLELAAPRETIERVAVSRLYPSRITSIDELDEFLEALRERLEKILAQGASILLE
jgi:negative regulator of replication initiation